MNIIERFNHFTRLNPVTEFKQYCIDIDPKLKSKVRSTYIDLDTQPYVMNKEPSIPCVYKSYKDITGGNILYYNTDTSLNPFYPQVFDESDEYTINIENDPMLDTYIEYKLIPKNPLGSPQWLIDENNFRRELMSTQMIPTNQNRYTQISRDGCL